MKRIVVELKDEDFSTLKFVKNLMGIQWKDLIIAGALWWTDEVFREETDERKKKVIAMVEENILKLKEKIKEEG